LDALIAEAYFAEQAEIVNADVDKTECSRAAACCMLMHILGCVLVLCKATLEFACCHSP
jgi:hypothetical protein